MVYHSMLYKNEGIYNYIYIFPDLIKGRRREERERERERAIQFCHKCMFTLPKVYYEFPFS